MKQSIERGIRRIEERLVQKALDGECCRAGRALAEWLMARSPSAARAAAEARGVKDLVRVWHSAQQPAAERPRGAAESVWERVERRIAQEERASVYLGRRRFEDAERQGRAGVVWGLSGAAAAAAALAVVLFQWRSEDRTPGGGEPARQIAAAEFAPEVETVSHRGAIESAPRYFGEGRLSQAEMDWLRSEGRVSLIHDHEQQLPIIWVRPKPARAGVPSPEEGREAIRMLNENVPMALPVGGRAR